MDLSARLELYCLIPDDNPFILYGIEIITRFSKTIIPKTYEDFYQFHKTLCYFVHYDLGDSTKLLEILPALSSGINYVDPYNTEDIEVINMQYRRRSLHMYLTRILRIYTSPLFDRSQPWISLMRDFLQVDSIRLREEASARCIQKHYRIYKSWLNHRKQIQYLLYRKTFRKRGYLTNIQEFPNHLIVMIFSFLPLDSLCNIASVSNRWYELTKQPILWKTLNLFPNRFQLTKEKFEQICLRAWQLKKLDLRYCQYVNTETLTSIAHNCNPKALKELLLDGCENICDISLTCLIEKFTQAESQTNQALEGSKFDEDLKGGARGIEILSLAECRMITDQGVAFLRKLKRLKHLNILGCYSVTDEGIQCLLKGARNLETFNVSGTFITRESLILIKEKCTKLNKIILNGCRLLSYDDRNIISGIEVHFKEDIFRFQLTPAPGSKLPNITNNVLRTRSSLAIQRVCHYVNRKLDLYDIEIDIVCKEKILSHYYTLKNVRKELWDDSVLCLNYQLKAETILAEEKKQKESWVGNIPRWVPNHESNTCMKCEELFWVFLRRHHCRKCGKLVCNDCSKGRKLIPYLGFTQLPVRVCRDCDSVLNY